MLMKTHLFAFAAAHLRMRTCHSLSAERRIWLRKQQAGDTWRRCLDENRPNLGLWEVRNFINHRITSITCQFCLCVTSFCRKWPCNRVNWCWIEVWFGPSSQWWASSARRCLVLGCCCSEGGCLEGTLDSSKSLDLFSFWWRHHVPLFCTETLSLFWTADFLSSPMFVLVL